MSVEYYSVTRVAKMLKVRRGILIRLIRAERLPAIDLGVDGKVNLRVAMCDVASALRYVPKNSKRNRRSSRTDIKEFV